MSQQRPLPELLIEIDQLVARQQYSQASLIFKQIFDLHPGEPTALRKLASLIFQLGQHEAAITMLADSLDPENPDPETVIDLANLLRAMDRVPEAADLLYATALHFPHYPGLGSLAIESLQQENRQEEANEIQALLAIPNHTGA